MRTNCVNCGAAIDTDVCKCPFCGTSYFDLTAIDFTSHEPVALRLKIPFAKGNVLLSMLAMPNLGSIEYKEEQQFACGGPGGRPLIAMTTNIDVDVGVSFRAVPRGNTLYSAEVQG